MEILLLCLVISTTILVLVSAFLPFPICTLFWLITYIVIIVCSIICIIYLISNIIRKRKIKTAILSLIVFVINFFIYNSLYNLERCFVEVSKYMKENYSNYKIVGINEKNLKNEMADCNYMLDVQLNDNTNIKFQSGYCSLKGGFMPSYEVIDTYMYYYVPYYFNKYKTNNNVSFKLKMKKYDYHNIKIIYNNKNKKEVYYFLKYLKDNIKKKNGYTVIIYNEDKDDEKYISSWEELHYYDILDYDDIIELEDEYRR